MSRMRQSICCLAAAVVGFTTHAQSPLSSSAKFSPVVTNLLPMVPTVQCPVEFFRQLLAMSPVERNNSLTNRSPETRARILDKVHEYQRLGADECELRLRATELRWYLTPLMRTPPAERGARLEQLPPDVRELAKSRLTQWDLLPPQLQQEFLANDRTLHYFARVETTNSLAANPGQQKIAEEFNHFFDLTPAEKKQTLGTLSGAERAQMEKTLQTFEQLPAQKRILCVRNYAKFAGMGAAERAEFLKNAESWAKMSPAERQSWRDLVQHVPLWPPAPPAPLPPVPQSLPKIHHASVATN
jgi:hypothetical protein